MAAVALFVIVPVRPWYSPQYAIPLLGMILGNTLNGISLGLDRLGGELAAKRGQVEALSRSERRAGKPPVSRSSRQSGQG